MHGICQCNLGTLPRCWQCSLETPCKEGFLNSQIQGSEAIRQERTRLFYRIWCEKVYTRLIDLHEANRKPQRYAPGLIKGITCILLIASSRCIIGYNCKMNRIPRRIVENISCDPMHFWYHVNRWLLYAQSNTWILILFCTVCTTR